MKITVQDGIKLTPKQKLQLAMELIDKGYTKDTFNYGLITRGVFDSSPLSLKIVVHQEYGTDRKTEFSPVKIIIKKFRPIFNDKF